MYVCNCKGITEADFKKLKADGNTFELYAHVMPVTGACCKCLPQIKEIFSKDEALIMTNYTTNDLHTAGMELAVKALDYEDAIDLDDCRSSWTRFVEARNNYRTIRDALRGKT